MSMFLNNRPVQKTLLIHTTRLSLHERFAYLRNNAAEASGSSMIQRQRELQQQTARNRRIAMQMERRPAVMAALKLKKKSLRQRLGMGGVNTAGISASTRGGASIKDRLSLGRKGRRMIGRGSGRGLNRSSLQQTSIPQVRRGRQRGRGPPGGPAGGRGRMSRSQSIQSINNAGRFPSRARSRSRSRSRIRTNSISNNNNNNNNINLSNQRFRNRIQRGGRGTGNPRFMQQKQRGTRRGGLNTSFRGRGGWGQSRGRGDRGKGGRGNLRGGRGRPGIGRRQQNVPVPTREELDNQLDQYMANSRFSLDKDLDSYMKQATSLGTTSSGPTSMMEESWD